MLRKKEKKPKFWLNVSPIVGNAHSTLGRCVKFTICLLWFMHSLLKQARKDSGVAQHALPSALGACWHRKEKSVVPSSCRWWVVRR